MTNSRARNIGRTTRVMGLVLVGAMVMGACGEDGAGTADRAGGSTPVVLRIGSPYGPGRPNAEQIEELARRVEELSGGDLVLEPSWGVESGQGVGEWDQLAAQRVIDGEVDLALVPARAWDVLGVRTLRALNAPLVITSDEALEAVLTDIALTDQLLAGLDEADVTGLGLFREGPRRLFLVGDPMPSLGDLPGHVVRTPTSATVAAFYEALGATADDFDDDPAAEDAAIAAGELIAFETSFELSTTIGLPTTAVGNVALFPNVNALVANRDAYAELSDEHRAILDEAVQATLLWSFGQQGSDSAAASEYCAGGGRIIIDESINTLLEDAAATVIDQLDDDPDTAEAIEGIRAAIRTTSPASAIGSCDSADVSGGGVTSEGEFPEGVYRAAITEQSLLDAGVNEIDAANHAGEWTMTFEDGVLTVFDVNADSGRISEEEGVYCVEDGRVRLGLLSTPPECGDFWNGAWEVDGDTLRFVDVLSDHGFQTLIAALFGREFTRIG